MEQISTGPVEHRHEVVANHLYSESGKIFDGLFIVLNVLIPGWQADFDVVMDIDTLHNVHVETIGLELLLNFGDFIKFPYFSRHFVMKRPDDALHTRNLLDIAELNLVVALTVPTPCHFHARFPPKYF